MTRRITLRPIVRSVFITLAVAVVGCVSLVVPTDSGGPGGTGFPDDGDGGGEAVPTVRLSVSNVTPQLFEEVVFRCEVSSGGNGVTYDYQPASARLTVNHAAGTALLIVSESDLGTAMSITCTGENAAGVGPASNSVTVTPAGS